MANIVVDAETAPTLADCIAIIDAAPPPILVEIVDALRVMRDSPAALVVDADDHHQRRPRAGWWRRRQRGKSSH